MATALRSKIVSLAPMLGFKIKVVENTGTNLAAMLSNKNPWKGQPCGRQCSPCSQKSEHREDCVVENILYESVCVKCNGFEKEKAKE